MTLRIGDRSVSMAKATEDLVTVRIQRSKVRKAILDLGLAELLNADGGLKKGASSALISVLFDVANEIGSYGDGSRIVKVQ